MPTKKKGASPKPNRGAAVIERVTNQLIADIEAGAGEWNMPWAQVASTDLPRSIDGRYYRGINTLVLHFEAIDRGFTSGIWGTYNAWSDHGGQVRKGEKSTEVILWKPWTRTEQGANGEETQRSGMMVRTFRVFAAEQQDGWQVPEVEPRNSDERIAHCEGFFDGIGANVHFGGNHASYNKLADHINCPHLDQFASASHFYSTLGHEHIHWTGHKSRLDREFGKRFGDDAYGAEELVAELGAALLSARFGIDGAVRRDHAAYLSSWLRVLKQDARSLVTVMSRAQAGVDFLETAAGGVAANDDDQQDTSDGDDVVAEQNTAA
jgi:antirestriction protein ArdC